MSEPNTGQGRALATTTPTPREIRVVEGMQPLFDTARFEQFQRAALALSFSTLLPESVRGESDKQCFSNLMMIFDQADRWGLPATAVAQCVSIVHGKLMYEGKLIAAMLEGRLGVALDYEWSGTPGADTYAIRVFATRPGETTPREIRGTVRDWATNEKGGARKSNWVGAASTMQLAYRGAREWARLWAPGLLLGVYGDDEFDAFEDRRAQAMNNASGPAITAGFAAQPVQEATFEPVDEKPVDESAKPAPQTGPAAAQAQEGPTSAVAQSDGKPADSGPAKESAAARKKREAGEAEAAQAAQDQADAKARLVAEAEAAGEQAALAGKRYPMTFDAAYSPEEITAFKKGYDETKEDQASGPSGSGPAAADPPFVADVDESEAQEEQPEPEPADDAPHTAFDFFTSGLRDCINWGAIKTSLAALSRTDDWKTAASPSSTLIRQARIGAWCRVLELQAQGSESVDFINDVSAFRCWAEHCEKDAVILERWADVIETAAYKSLQDGQRAALQKGVELRVRQIRAAAPAAQDDEETV